MVHNLETIKKAVSMKSGLEGRNNNPVTIQLSPEDAESQ